MTHLPGKVNGSAVFIGYQKGWGTFPSFPMFTITLPGHPRYGSSVSLETLKELNIPIPDYPKHDEVPA
jgi:hypothetical protein